MGANPGIICLAVLVQWLAASAMAQELPLASAAIPSC